MKAREVVGMLVEGTGLFRAQLETRNFTFEAYGLTAKAAESALINGLVSHGQQYNLPAQWFEPLREDMETHQLEMGAAYRDRQVLPPARPSAAR